MARQLTLQSMFTPIDKEELEEHVEHDFAILSKNLELEKAMEEDVVKRPVERPKKQLEAVFHVLMGEKSEEPIRKKVRGTYTNWFLPSLWGSIHATMKQHKNYTSTLHYLRTKYRLPGQIRSLYADLSRGTLWD